MKTLSRIIEEFALASELYRERFAQYLERKKHCNAGVRNGTIVYYSEEVLAELYNINPHKKNLSIIDYISGRYQDARDD